MTEVQILDIMYEAFQLAMKLSLPFLLISMIVGVVIAVFQAATQINEQTMTFVPKLLAIMVLLGFLGSSMLVMPVSYTHLRAHETPQQRQICIRDRFYAGHASGIFSIHSGIDRKGVKKIYVYHIFNGSDAYERSHRIQSPFWKK